MTIVSSVTSTRETIDWRRRLLLFAYRHQERFGVMGLLATVVLA
jgi:hypothetical protein